MIRLQWCLLLFVCYFACLNKAKQAKHVERSPEKRYRYRYNYERPAQLVSGLETAAIEAMKESQNQIIKPSERGNPRLWRIGKRGQRLLWRIGKRGQRLWRIGKRGQRLWRIGKKNIDLETPDSKKQYEDIYDGPEFNE